MKSKYIVLAIAFLLVLSSTSSIASATSSKGKIFAPSAVDTHGPRIAAIDFSVIAVDSALANSLGTGGIQVAEWSFLAGTYASLHSNSAVKEAKTLGYTFDGIAFNNALPTVGDLHFRQAIQYLTNYGQIQSISLAGIEGSAQPYLMPCAVYPLTCNNKVPLEKYSLPKAAVALSEDAALYAKYNGAAITTAGIKALSTSKLSGLSWWTDAGFTKAFNPLLYFRNDDPLRTSVATLLHTAALAVGLNIQSVGISSHEAGGDVYGASEGEVLTNGGYCASGPNAGYNDCPTAKLNETAGALAADSWAMYTFGWVTSSAFTFQAGYEWTSSQVNNDNFNAFINRTMDFYNNEVLYGSTMAISETAAKTVNLIFAQQLPSVISFYQSYLYADYVNGWTGYAGEPTTGANTGGGDYYTMLNVHPTNGLGGTLSYGLHQSAIVGALNPIAYPNWVWAADLYTLMYDTPLGTPVAKFTTPNAYMSWMLQGTDPDAPADSTMCTSATGLPTTGCQIASFNGLTPADGFALQCLPADVNYSQPSGCNIVSGVGLRANIVNGQAITFTFANNITFSDNVPVTAADYNYSLWALDLTLPPSMPWPAFSPYYGGMAGPLGLWATEVNNGGRSITMYVNDSAVWNVLDVTVYVLPQHLFQYLNPVVADAYEGQIDFSMPYGTATSAAPGSTQGVAPASITYLPNINLASGPFWLNTINEATGSGILTAYQNYFRSAWYDNLKNNEVYLKATKTPSNIVLTSTLQEYTYNAGATTFGGLAAAATGYVSLTQANLATSNTIAAYVGAGVDGTVSCSASAQKYTGSIPSANVFKGKPSGSSISLSATCSGNGQIVVSITPSTVTGMTKGIYEVTVTGHYVYFGEARTWYQFFGIYVH